MIQPFKLNHHLSYDSFHNNAGNRNPQSEHLQNGFTAPSFYSQQLGNFQAISSELDPKYCNISASTRISTLSKKRKSEEIGKTQLPIFEEALVGLKKSKSCLANYYPNERGPAVFENGMRVTAGRGRMNTDYEGVVLPLLNEYLSKHPGIYEVPWMDPTKTYSDMSDGTERFVSK